jgi:hypothetical protein
VRRQAVARKAREAAAEKLKGLDTCPPGTPNCLPVAIKVDKLLGDQRPDLPDYSSAAELAAGEKVTDARRWLEGRYGSRLEAAGSAREFAATLSKLPPGTRALVFITDFTGEVYGHALNAIVLESGEVLILHAQRSVRFYTTAEVDQLLSGALWNSLSYIVTYTP